MKIALIHNYYQQAGGEDRVFASEVSLLEARGHHVATYTIHNDRIGKLGAASLAHSTIWNHHSIRELRRVFGTRKSEIAHFHNTFPLISPAGYYAARAEGLAVVQTVHNYRLICPVATLFRGGRVCEDCIGKTLPWPGVLHGCYRQSRAATAAVAAMLTAHRALGTWRRAVDIYVALTDFAKAKLVEAGLPAERIVVKPNFVNADPGAGSGAGGFAVFVGRLSVEKGISTLIEAWDRFRPDIPLRLAGDGPLALQVAATAERLANVEWLGQQTRLQTVALLKDAAFLILPSVWYEAFPLVIIEAFAVGLPVVASNLGSLSTIIDHGRTGRLCQPGSAKDLVAQVAWLREHPAELRQMRIEARAEYEAKYTADRNYDMLLEVYARAKASTTIRSS